MRSFKINSIAHLFLGNISSYINKLFYINGIVKIVKKYFISSFNR